MMTSPKGGIRRLVTAVGFVAGMVAACEKKELTIEEACWDIVQACHTKDDGTDPEINGCHEAAHAETQECVDRHDACIELCNAAPEISGTGYESSGTGSSTTATDSSGSDGSGTGTGSSGGSSGTSGSGSGT